jgi:hypothetical protein
MVVLHGQSQTGIAHLTVHELHSPNAYLGLSSHDCRLSTAIHGITGHHLTITGYELLLTATGEVPSQSQIYVMTGGHLASLSWFQAPSGAQDQTVVTVKQLLVC